MNPPRVDGSGGGTTPVTTTRPDVRYRTYHNRRRGTAERLPVGIDPGFAWNPGAGRAGTVQRAFLEKDRRVTRAMHPSAPQGTPVSGALNVRMRSDRGVAVKRALEAIDRVHGDGPLPEIPVVTSRAKRFLGAFRHVQSRGLDIRIAAGDHLELTMAHEVGHFLDMNGMPGRGYESVNATLPEMREVLERIRATATFQELTRRNGYYYQNYLQDPQELWARAYTQYIATSGLIGTKESVLGFPLVSLRASLPHAKWSIHHSFVGGPSAA